MSASGVLRVYFLLAQLVFTKKTMVLVYSYSVYAAHVVWCMAASGGKPWRGMCPVEALETMGRASGTAGCRKPLPCSPSLTGGRAVLVVIVCCKRSRCTGRISGRTKVSHSQAIADSTHSQLAQNDFLIPLLRCTALRFIRPFNLTSVLSCSKQRQACSRRLASDVGC